MRHLLPLLLGELYTCFLLCNIHLYVKIEQNISFAPNSFIGDCYCSFEYVH